MLTVKTQKFEDGTQNVYSVNEFVLFTDLYDGDAQVHLTPCSIVDPSADSFDNSFWLGSYSSLEKAQEVIDNIFYDFSFCPNLFVVMPVEEEVTHSEESQGSSIS